MSTNKEVKFAQDNDLLVSDGCTAAEKQLARASRDAGNEYSYENKELLVAAETIAAAINTHGAIVAREIRGLATAVEWLKGAVDDLVSVVDEGNE